MRETQGSCLMWSEGLVQAVLILAGKAKKESQWLGAIFQPQGLSG